MTNFPLFQFTPMFHNQIHPLDFIYVQCFCYLFMSEHELEKLDKQGTKFGRVFQSLKRKRQSENVAAGLEAAEVKCHRDQMRAENVSVDK